MVHYKIHFYIDGVKGGKISVAYTHEIVTVVW